METIIKFVKNLRKYLVDERQKYEEGWEYIGKYIAPMRENALFNRPMGSTTGSWTYNGQAIICVNTLVHGFLGHVVSPMIPWFDLAFTDDKLSASERAGVWLEEVRKHFYTVLERSNFYSALNDYTWDAATIATGHMMQYKDRPKDKYRFLVMCPTEVYISRNWYGEVDTMVRVFQLNARQMVQEFGKDNLNEAAKNSFEKNPFQKFEVVHAVYPNDERAFGNLPKLGPYKAFKSVYIQGDVGDDGKPLSVSGFDRFPGRTWCWDRAEREMYGRGPGHNALFDIIPLNRLSKDMLIASNLAVNPPMMVPWEHRGRIRIVPGGLNYYKNLGMERIEPVITGINYPITRDREEVIEQRIKEHYMTDFFLMLSQAEKPMTATEILEKQAEKAVALGPVVARIEGDCLDPVLEDLYLSELEDGKLPPPPQEVIDAGGSDIKIDYIGPLAQIQRRAFKMRGVSSSLEAIAPVVALFPDAIDKINYDVMMEEILDTYGMPKKAIRPDEEVEAIRAARAEQQQAMAQLEAARQMAEVVPKLTQGGGTPPIT